MTASCNGRVLSPTLDIPAGATGAHSQTYSGIPAGSVCSATAGPDGGTSTVQVTITGDGGYGEHPGERGRRPWPLTDTYTSLRGLVVGDQDDQWPRRRPTGSGHGPDGLQRDGTLAGAHGPGAGAAAGTYSQTYEDIPAGSTCTVQETANGSTSTVSVTTTGAGQSVVVPAAHVAEADITDTYSLTAGSLTVTKTIAGPAAGHQGVVTVQTVCNGSALSPALTVPARSGGGHLLAYVRRYSRRDDMSGDRDRRR